ncbi:MAG: S8 family serine peptidase, partial [Bacteroidota bacterium]
FAQGLADFVSTDSLTLEGGIPMISSEDIQGEEMDGSDENGEMVDNLDASSEENGSQFQEEPVVMFPSHAGVYFPAKYFQNDVDAQERLEHFQASVSGRPFANWVLERDTEAFASDESLPLIEEEVAEGDLDILEESSETSSDPMAQGSRRVLVYCHIIRSLAAPLWPSGKAEGVKVAVLDTGLDRTNSLLMRGSMGGVSMIPYERSYMDYNGHGTHVSGIIAARPSIHRSGLPLYWSIAPAARHYTVKVLDRRGRGAWSWIARGIDAARVKGVDVINMSLGSRGRPPVVVHRAIQKAAKQAVIVAAAGNSGPGANTVGWPARYREVIGVGAVDCNRKIASFSSRGPRDSRSFVEDHVECVAPGVDIYSNQLRGGSTRLTKKSGTSMASPVVAGICALLKQKNRRLKGTWAFRYRLRRSFIDLGISGPDNWYGLGQAFFHGRS